MGRPAYTKAERAARWAKMADYLRRAGSMPAAVKLAKREHFTAPTSAWITAVGKMLGRHDNK